MSTPDSIGVQELVTVASAEADKLLSDETIGERERIAQAFLRGATHGARMVEANTISHFAVLKAKQ